MTKMQFWSWVREYLCVEIIWKMKLLAPFLPYQSLCIIYITRGSYATCLNLPFLKSSYNPIRGVLWAVLSTSKHIKPNKPTTIWEESWKFLSTKRREKCCLHYQLSSKWWCKVVWFSLSFFQALKPTKYITFRWDRGPTLVLIQTYLAQNLFAKTKARERESSREGSELRYTFSLVFIYTLLFKIRTSFFSHFINGFAIFILD